jgi:3-oxoacyl-[acyl-carrier-protein] synthase II
VAFRNCEGDVVRVRVVVTGMGIVCPIGNDLDGVWLSLMEGRSGTDLVTRVDATDLPSRIAGEVRGFDPAQWLAAKEAKRTDRVIKFAVAAARQALEQAGLRELDCVQAERTAVLIGSALGGMETVEREFGVLFSRGPSRVSPFLIPMFLPDMAGGYVSILTGARGPSFSTVSACASGANALGEGAELIRRGDADIVIAGGSEAAITRGVIAGFCALHALSTRNEEPRTASRPFDRSRDGFVIAEGAAVLVLERLEHALERRVPVLAELRGYGSTSDAYHIVQPCVDGDGAARCMREAIRDAGLRPDDIDYINAHGTSTPLNDAAETSAIKRVFSGHRIPPVSSTKALTGHLLGAAGAVESVFSIMALQHGVIPPTWHLEQIDPACDLDYVIDGPRRAPLRHVMNNAFGFGGHNASLIFSRYED